MVMGVDQVRRRRLPQRDVCWQRRHRTPSADCRHEPTARRVAVGDWSLLALAAFYALGALALMAVHKRRTVRVVSAFVKTLFGDIGTVSSS